MDGKPIRRRLGRRHRLTGERRRTPSEKAVERRELSCPLCHWARPWGSRPAWDINPETAPIFRVKRFGGYRSISVDPATQLTLRQMAGSEDPEVREEFSKIRMAVEKLNALMQNQLQ